MTTIDLIVECDEVLSIDPRARVQGGQYVKVSLDDVNVEDLLVQLAEKLDVETVLDYFSDDAIKGYLEQKA